MLHEVEALIDLGSYPVHELDRSVRRSVVEAARKTFDDTSLVVLDGFLRPAAIRRITELSLAHGCADSRRAYPKTTVAFDRLDSASPLRALYGWEPLTRFIEAVVGGPVHRSEYTVVLHNHAPQAGGVLQYVARSRSELTPDHTLLRKIATGRRHTLARDLPTVPGTLVLHAGRVSMHCVTRAHGPDPRISAPSPTTPPRGSV